MRDDVPSDDVLGYLKTLISFDTVSYKPNRPLIEWAAEECRAAGASLIFDEADDGEHVNMLASWGNGPGGLVLSGHTDVVPVDGQAWSNPPFTATIHDDRVYGRGACDMKGFLAVAMACAIRYGRNAKPDAPPIHVAFSYDEERGCLGIPGLLRAMANGGIQPDACVVGEPTMMALVSAHKGGRIFRCRVQGTAMHSSLAPRGVNAVEYAARLITFISDLAREAEENGPQDPAFDIGCSTISVNQISGGNGGNIIPAECVFNFEYRFFPQSDPDWFIGRIRDYIAILVADMQKKDSRTGIVLEMISAIPALQTPSAASVQRLMVRCTGHNSVSKVAYGTEASFFQEAGIPAIVCGPGSIEQAHKADEFVALSQLAVCEATLDRLIRLYTAGIK